MATNDAHEINPVMALGDWTRLLALSALWGGSFIFVEVAVAAVPPLTLVWVRVALAALCLWAIVLASGRSMPRAPQAWAAFAVLGLLNNALPFTLIAWGQTEIAAGQAAILNATTPIFAVLVAGLALSDEPLGWRKAAGVLCGLAGVAVMVGPGAVDGLGRPGLAQLAVLGAAFFYATAVVFGRRFAAMGLDPLVVATGQVSCSSLILLPLALTVDGPPTLVLAGLDAGVWASLLGLGTVSTALAYILYFRLLAAAGAVNAVLVTLLVPAFAVGLGALMLGESLGAREAVGMAAIALGLAVIDGRALRWRDTPRRA